MVPAESGGFECTRAASSSSRLGIPGWHLQHIGSYLQWRNMNNLSKNLLGFASSSKLAAIATAMASCTEFWAAAQTNEPPVAGDSMIQVYE